MLSAEEKTQICRKYVLKCGICETENEYFRLKRDIVQAAKTEGDGHALSYKWSKPGFDAVNPLDFYFGVCSKCTFTGELDDADFRQAERNIKQYREGIHADGFRGLLTGMSTGSGIGQALSKRLGDPDPLVVVVAQFHLGIFCQCLRQKLVPGSIARYYLRLAWIYRDIEKFYPDSTVEQVAPKFVKLAKRFQLELPKHKDYPAVPALALTEVDALRFARTYFERNYETLREARVEDELRLRYLLAEIGYRLYELTDSADDFKKAAAYFSGTMQQCLSIVSDKSIVGGAVNRAKEMLEKAGERGRELRILNKQRGSGDKSAEGKAAAKAKKVKATVKAAEETSAEPVKTVPEKSAAAKVDSAAAGQGDTLQDEVQRLQGRVKELEDENKRLKQMIRKARAG